MANYNIGGHDLRWVDDPPEDLICLICLAVARDPQQHSGNDTNDCGKIFCQECITEHMKNSNTCPNCRHKLTLFKDAKSTRAIRALKVKCNNGCSWIGELGSLEKHLQTCEYALVMCTNQCKTDNKVTQLLRGQLNNHLRNNCSRHEYECPHCKLKGEHQEMTNTHLKICPSRVHCPNVQCDTTSYSEKDIEVHRLTCPYEHVPCKYTAFGCQETPSRKNLAEHENNDELHLQLTVEKVLDPTRKLAHIEMIQEEQIKVRSAKLSPFTFKLSNNKIHKNQFYTSHSGYKMCLSVYPNGHDVGEGSHISLFVYLMKGDNDDTLTWPFTGNVTIELLNQLKDEHHYGRIITFTANDDISLRPMTDENRIAWCSVRFISHTDLGYRDDQKTQYLKDDNLVFRVSVEMPDYKPWLD